MFNLDNLLAHAFSDHEAPNEVEFNDSTSDPQCYTLDGLNHRDLCLPSLSTSDQRNAILKCIDNFLLEDQNDSFLWQDSLALQATEKSLYDVLIEKHPPNKYHSQSQITNPHNLHHSYITHSINNEIGVDADFDYLIKNPIERFIPTSCSVEAAYGRTFDSLANSFRFWGSSDGSQVIQISPLHTRGAHKIHYRDDNDDCLAVGRSNKQLASFSKVTDEQPDMFDKVLLCSCLDSRLQGEFSVCLCNKSVPKTKSQKKKKPTTKMEGNRKEVVDLMTLLTHCGQAVGKNDKSGAYALLKQIKQHSSPLGDGIERLAHHVAKALEARLSGTGKASDASNIVRRLSPIETLKTYLAYVSPCPFKKMADFFANRWIWKLSENSSSIHIIDFGILHGFQWPHLIQHLSSRHGGPPNLRITGIDFPQPGFRPSERTEEAGRLLAHYCKRFNVPFEYSAIAKKWDEIKLEDLEIRENEVLIVNCLYWLRYLPDETVMMNSPRDAVLSLIRKIQPDLFIHGIINASYSGPFFETRFRDLMLNFYTAFDMYDSILPREDEGRILFERELVGRTLMSVIACEGVNRVVRPETYKQWQMRNCRAGLKQLPLDEEIVKDVREKVKLGYHKDFVVDVDSDWMLQGWKGRIFTALSCWKPLKHKIKDKEAWLEY